ncbi:NYN domain-containing protein [Salmonella enterica subsp. enterica serovar Bareilly]|nr:NYN domain-containing protein [Salmonella enterica subsp. enterica serovar Bredeney]EHE4123970.1 NYN domain-containing protein [Salmonella enterica subsp. enterica serovar Bareilly]
MLQVEITEKDIIPTINQKGVDMRIGLDIASLSLKKQVDAIVLVSADSDFIPALKFARREGVQVFVLSLGWNIKPDLYAHTDMLISDKLHLSLSS